MTIRQGLEARQLQPGIQKVHAGDRRGGLCVPRLAKELYEGSVRGGGAGRGQIMVGTQVGRNGGVLHQAGRPEAAGEVYAGQNIERP